MSKCASCTYHARYCDSRGVDDWGCDYIGYTGHRRGCPYGDKCLKYVPLKDSERRKAFKFSNGPKDYGDRERMYRQGMTDSEIARTLGKTPGAVYSWRTLRGYPPNPAARPRPEAEVVREALWEKGMTDGEIAEAQGVCRDTVKSWRYRYGLPCNRKQAKT